MVSTAGRRGRKVRAGVGHERGRELGLVLLSLIVGFFISSAAFAQQPAAPAPDPGTWVGTAGAGFALTSGNSDTLNFNVAFDATRDPKTRNVTKWTGLFIRGEQNDALVANRLSLAFRDQYALSDRSFVYGQLDYLRDTFKLIDYLIAPTAGVGYKLVNTPVTKFAVDGGLGVVWEKNPARDARTSMALTAGEKLEHQLTPTSTLKHAATGLWKAKELADSLYTVSVGLGTKISEQLGLSVDLLDTFKNRPPTAATEKNDVALVTAITAKF
jgi:putative salt-induced outer membrane protein YdiY